MTGKSPSRWPSHQGENPPDLVRALRPVTTKPWVAGLRLAHQRDGTGFHNLAISGIPSSMADAPFRDPGRLTPAKGVHISLGGANWVFLTVCTNHRERWLAQPSVQRALHDIWEHKATAWLVSDYLLMPDHLHLFCAPRDLKFTVERWISFWKDRFSKSHPDTGTFQPGGFHHRLRDGESYAQKWQYVRENPVRHGMAEKAEGWPYFVRVHEIRF